MKDASPRRYPALRAIWLSFYSRDLYRDVRSNWKGTGLGLLCAVFALLGVLLAARFQVWTAAEVPGFAEKIPPFQVAQGEFTSPVAQPYRIDYPKGCIMVDTTGKFRSIDQVPGVEGFETAYLVTKDGYSVRQVRRGKVEDRYHPFKPTTHFAATRGDIDRWTKALVRWAGPGLYVVYLPIFLPIEVLVLLVYALVAVLFAELARRDLDYGDAFRMSAVAHLPGLMVFTVLSLVGFHGSTMTIWKVLFALGYVAFAVGSLEKKAPEQA